MTLEHKINTSFIRRIGNAASSALSALSGVGKYVVFAGLSIAALMAYSCGKDAAQSIPEYKDIQQIEDVAQQDIAPDTHPYSKTCLIDKDNDNYGIKENNVFVGWDEECPKGYKILEPPFDCNDKIKSINPGAKELCNNLDDNCNGEIDEGLEMECMTECGPGIMKCIQGQYKNCSAPVKSDEICDCLDNDCDGQIDELPECCVSGESKLQQTCSDGKLKEEELCVNCNWEHFTYIETSPEICNGIDDDCNGSIDELITCCKPGSVKNQVICGNGDVKSEEKCVNYQWQPFTYLLECKCSKYVWNCKEIDTVPTIGKQCADAGAEDDFTQQNINDSNSGEECVNEWCCKNGIGSEYGCWISHIEINCYCVTGYDAVNDKGERVFSDGGACPKHDFCDADTDVEVQVKNIGVNASEVWLNWSNYGYPPGEKEMLQPGQSAEYKIKKNMIPVEGTTVQVCSSYDGCSDDIPVNCGDKSIINKEISGGEDYKPCDRNTEVTADFNNFKTLDLVVWINWLSGGFPPVEMPTIHPGNGYTYYLDEKNVPKEGALIELCTSSYGCSQPVEIKCGDKIYFNVDWVFGSHPASNSNNNNEGE